MDGFWCSVSVAGWIAIAVLLAAFVAQMFHYACYMALVPRRLKRGRPGKTALVEDVPGVSVIICARDEADNLKAYLPSVLEQDYPLFEVIVVNDGSVDDTEQVLEQYEAMYDNLRTTFVPKGAHVLSSKKLGLSLGIKAARYDRLLFTDADCRPASPRWLASMAEAFDQQTDIVLGLGVYYERDTWLNRLIGYETLFNGLQYLGMAMAGKPYMGVGRNMAYRKQFFFESGGFAGMLGLKAGDDDLFVNKNATSQNTRVVVEPDALTWSIPKKTWRNYIAQKGRHLSVSTHYSVSSKRRLAAEPLSRLIFYVSCLTLICTGVLWMKLFAICLLLARWLVQMSVMNKAARRLGLRKYGPGIMLFDIVLPLLNLYMLLRAGNYRNRW